MKNARLAIVLVLICALLLPSIQASAATTVRVKIFNSSYFSVILTLKGPRNYTLVLPPGRGNIEVEKGTYTYEYTSCERTYQGKKSFIREENAFQINKCRYTRVPVINETDGNITLTLRAKNVYSYSIPLGKFRLTLMKIPYKMTAIYCGKVETRTIDLSKGRVVLKFKCP